MKNELQTVLVTGGAGYIGSACVKALCDTGNSVVVIDNLSNGDKSYIDPRASFKEGDVLDTEFLESVFLNHKPKIVIHMAALKAVGESETQPERYFRNNVVGTLNMLAASAKHGAEKFIFSSTASVYGAGKADRFSESDELDSASVYGESKIMAEKLIENFHRTGKIPAYCVFRYFNVAGDAGLNYVERNSQNLIPAILRAYAESKPLSVFGCDYSTRDGSCVRDYVHLKDIVDAHVLALSAKSSGTYNLGSTAGVTVMEILAAFRKSGISVAHVVDERRAGDPASVCADASKAALELGWKPKYGIDEIVQSVTRTIHGT